MHNTHTHSVSDVFPFGDSLSSPSCVLQVLLGAAEQCDGGGEAGQGNTGQSRQGGRLTSCYTVFHVPVHVAPRELS